MQKSLLLALIFCVLSFLQVKADDSKVSELIKSLSSKNDDIKYSAIEKLSKLGEKAHPAVPMLVKLLVQTNYKLRSSVVIALGKIGEKSHSAVPALIALLNKEIYSLKPLLLKTLGKIGEKAHPAVPTLVKLLHGSDDEMHCHVAKALGKIGEKSYPAIPLLIKFLAKEDYDYTLEDLLSGDLTSGVVDIKSSAIFALEKIGKKAIPALTKALSDKNKDIRTAAAKILKAKNLVPQFIQNLDDKDKEVRKYAATALSYVSSGEKKAMIALAKALIDKEANVRIAVANALEKITMTTKTISSQVKDAFLKAIATDQNEKVRIIATRVLEQANSPEVVYALIMALADPSKKVKASAAHALGNMKARQAADDLVKLLFDTEILTSVATALAKFGEGKKAVPALLKALPDKKNLSEIIDILYQIGPDAKEAAPHLHKIFNLNSDYYIRKKALFALAKIYSDSSKQVPFFIKIIKEDSEMRSAAIGALGNFGANAKEAIPMLLKIASQENLDGFTAEDTLQKIDPKQK